MTLKLTQEAIDFLVDKGYDEKFGARPLKRAIQRLLENPLALALLEGEFQDGDTVRAYAQLGELRFTRDDEARDRGEAEAVGAEQ
jgi:ATP-dependent Clp protease ATP-binding subunit ClpA